MFCPKCGEKLADNMAFCPRCGSQIAVPPPVNKGNAPVGMNNLIGGVPSDAVRKDGGKPGRKKLPVAAVFVTALVLVAAAGAGLFLMLRGGGHKKLLKVNSYDKEGNLTSYQKAQYDDKGLLTKMVIYDKDGSKSSWIEYSYDSKGKRKREAAYSSDGKIKSQTEFNSQEKVTKQTNYLEGIELPPIEYSYDEKGMLLEEIHYGSDGSKTRLEYEYNSEKTEARLIAYDNDGSRLESGDGYSYARYDMKGNLTEKVIYGSDDFESREERSYNKDGKITKYIVSSKNPRTSSNTKTEYSYDKQGDLIETITESSFDSDTGDKVTTWLRAEYIYE